MSVRSYVVVGIVGLSGSGKSTFSELLSHHLGAERTLILNQDHYYRDLSGLLPDVRHTVNVDTPDALDLALFHDHLRSLKEGIAVNRPSYDFSTRTRLANSVRLDPRHVIIAEGLLLYSNPETRELIDVRIFLDVPVDHCLLRRLARDTAERSRTMASILHQYETSVRPFHEHHVEPQKRHSDLIVPQLPLERLKTIVARIADGLCCA